MIVLGQSDLGVRGAHDTSGIPRFSQEKERLAKQDPPFAPSPPHQIGARAVRAVERASDARRAVAAGAEQLEAAARGRVANGASELPKLPASEAITKPTRGHIERARAAGTRSSAGSDARSDLEAESALMAAALRALRAGWIERARFFCDEHERTFGAHALLAQERARMRRDFAQTLR
jgi:hypothetical protein